MEQHFGQNPQEVEILRSQTREHSPIQGEFPNGGLFLEKWKEVAQLKPETFRNFYMHDTRALLTSAEMSIELYFEMGGFGRLGQKFFRWLDQEETENTEEDTEKYALERLKKLHRFHRKNRNRIEETDIPEELQGAVKRADAVLTVLPIIETSLTFLQNPSAIHYNALLARRIQTGVLAEAVSPRVRAQSGRKIVNGFETIALLNLLTNARKHGSPDFPIRLLDGDALGVENVSSERIKPEYEQLMDSTGKAHFGHRIIDLMCVAGGMRKTLLQLPVYPLTPSRGYNIQFTIENDQKLEQPQIQ